MLHNLYKQYGIKEKLCWYSNNNLDVYLCWLTIVIGNFERDNVYIIKVGFNGAGM